MEKRVIGMSRKQFTKEFKEGAVRRLGLGASLAEVSPACEVNPNVLHRWKRELREHGVKAFTGHGKVREEECRVAELERKSAAKPWKTIFCGDACSMPRSRAGCKQ